MCDLCEVSNPYRAREGAMALPDSEGTVPSSGTNKAWGERAIDSQFALNHYGNYGPSPPII